jgi:hypothetical protein
MYRPFVTVGLASLSLGFCSERAFEEGSVTLANFFATEDLDDLQRAASKLGVLEEVDVRRIRSTLEEWHNEQAVANLLFYPRLIPEELRVKSIVRGLDERRQPYYVLAAAVGVQEMEVSTLTEEEMTVIRDRLLRVVASDSSIVAKRASVSLQTFLKKSDGETVCSLLGHPDETVRHNLLAWLVTTFEPGHSDDLRHFVEASELDKQTRQDITRQMTEYVQARREGKFTGVDMPLLGYIPNLSEFPRN